MKKYAVIRVQFPSAVLRGYHRFRVYLENPELYPYIAMITKRVEMCKCYEIKQNLPPTAHRSNGPWRCDQRSGVKPTRKIIKLRTLLSALFPPHDVDVRQT